MGVYMPNVKRPHCCRICPNPVCIPDGIHTLDALDFIMKRRHEHPDRRADDCPLEEIDIVRCGECKHLKADGTCDIFADDNIRPSVSDFCSHGERKE